MPLAFKQTVSIVIVALMFFTSGPVSLAAPYTWDANGVTAGTGGTGTWDTTSSLWDNGGLTPWPNLPTDTAVFGGTFGTVTLGGAISAGALIFNPATGGN